ncbi:ATP synthase subunit g, mitochondrial-like [Bombus affinis]|uniref:ATP synthase subunit g n=1 Tax=Bombus terrestris TaxID=30195 RepID=A0A9B0BW51_BOMTE|nr:ATP synthase subunit g, mitochondrial [Bombus terrestris]XP_050576695.1 ATP synthase subunit g, mitochondrial-like [Bombus affinis]
MSKLIGEVVGISKVLATKTKPAIRNLVYYGKVELVPPKISDIPAIKNGISNIISAAKNKRYLDLTVREAWLNTLVGIEILCWFFVGECIGKRHLIGYNV